MYDIIANVIKYAFVIVVYIFIFSVVKLVYLDISDARKRMAEDGNQLGYLKLINLRSDLDCKIFESYSLFEENTIGRSRKCNIHINDPYLSKEHARIFVENDKFYIEDLNSTNGTFVNKTQVTKDPIRLKDNDKIIFGDIRFIFISEI